MTATATVAWDQEVVNVPSGKGSGLGPLERRRRDHPDLTQELPRKLLPTRAKETQSQLRQKL